MSSTYPVRLPTGTLIGWADTMFDAEAVARHHAQRERQSVVRVVGPGRIGTWTAILRDKQYNNQQHDGGHNGR